MKSVFPLFVICFSVLVVDAYSQNVGVGTTSPTERLHVNGNIRTDTAKANVLKITPNAGDGKILTSDANGNASWQTKTLADGNGSVGYGTWGDCATNGAIGGFQPVSEQGLKSSSSYGKAISISGDFAVVGYSVDDIGANTNQGSAFIYHFDGTKWTQVQKITDPGGAASDAFGASVAMSGNLLLVGAPNDNIVNTDQGSVCVFEYNGTNWVFMQRLIDATGAASDHFGASVAVSPAYAVVGIPDDDIGANADQGSVIVFEFNGSTWALDQKLSESLGSAQDAFGTSVSVYNNRLIIGIPEDDVNGTDRGSANVYLKIVNWTSEIKLVHPDAAWTNFGISVSMYGNLVIVGSPDFINRGGAYVYQFTGFTWTLSQRIENTEGHSLDFFGESVCMSGDYLIIGAKYADRGDADVDMNSGTAFIYVRVGSGWSLLQKAQDPTSFLSNGENFGIRVAIDGVAKRFLVSATNFAGGTGKVVFGKIN